jgi:hypothetical protein
MSPNHETGLIPGPPVLNKRSSDFEEKSRDDKGRIEFKATEPIILFIDEESLVKSPMIEISVGNGMVIKAILDTGSEINLLAGSVYEKLITLGADVPTLPLEDVTLVIAFGKKSNRIKKQAMVEYAIGCDFFESNFFISPQLINDAILGCKFLKEYGITLDFKEGKFYLFQGWKG